MLEKNVKTKVEFGDYGNFADLTPIAITGKIGNTLVINFLYEDGRTIELCYKPAEVNEKTFA